MSCLDPAPAAPCELPRRAAAFLSFTLLVVGGLAAANLDVTADPLFTAPVSYATGGFPISVAIGDLDNDGKPDLAVANSYSKSVSVLLGNGDGTFLAKSDYETDTLNYSVAIGNLNSSVDGIPDLVVANTDYSGVSGAVSVLLGQGSGTFGPRTEYATGGFGWSAAIGSLNSSVDGIPDLVVAGGTVAVLRGKGDGTFLPKTDHGAGCAPYYVAIGDLNGDRISDLVVANFGYMNPRNSVSVLLGKGDGTFSPKTDFETRTNPASVAIGDLNNDGKPDLAVANFGTQNTPGNTVSVLLGNGLGAFGTKTDYPTGSAPHSVAIGDLDNDGKPDLAVGSSNEVSVLLGNGDGTFGARTDYGTGMGHDVTIGDLNGDCRLDLATANGASNTVSVLLNVGPPCPGDVDPALLAPPRTFRLLASRPNPSRGTSEIRFQLPSACTVDVDLFDLAGRKVRSLASGELSTPGEHSVRWDGRDNSGVPAHNGVYLARVRAGHDIGVKRLVVLR